MLKSTGSTSLHSGQILVIKYLKVSFNNVAMKPKYNLIKV